MRLLPSFLSLNRYTSAPRSVFFAFLMSFLALQSQQAYSQATMPQTMEDEIANLTHAIEVLSDAVTRTNLDTETYAPIMIAIGNNISASIQDFYALASFYNSSDYQDRVNRVYAAVIELDTLAQSLNDHKITVACAAVSVISAGVVVGMLAKKYIFTADKNKNILFRAATAGARLCSSCYHYCLPAPKKEERFLNEEAVFEHRYDLET